MTRVLRLNTSILGANSVSSSLIQELLDGLGQGRELQVTERDFGTDPVPHVDGDWLQALLTPEAERSAAQQRKVDYSDSLIAELQAADILVIGLPMYNFSVPSMLKAWNDHVARAGVTFRYTDSGPEGLLAGKKVYLVAAMGGVHEVGESDFLRPYMKQFLGLLGIDDITFITASGLNMGEQPRADGIAGAQREIAAAIQVDRQQRIEQAATSRRATDVSTNEEKEKAA